jgi:hypothetical protein
MKMKSKLIAMSSVAALLASPLAMADKAAGGAAVCGVAEEGVEITTCEEVIVAPTVVDEDVVEITLVEGEGEAIEVTALPDGEVIEGEVAVEPGVDAEPICDKEPIACEGEAVPVDWVKRGGGDVENPDVMFFTTADGGVAAPTVTKAEIELGQDDRAAVIEGKGTAAAQVDHEKKGPVALVKKGRVFLR